jgi:hypothetical protein
LALHTSRQDSGPASTRLLWTGVTEHIEFRELAMWLDRQATVTRLSDPQQAARHLRAPEVTPYDLILCGECRPGQFPQAVVEAIVQAAPLTPLVGLLGSWCEGETRSGHPWKGVPRLYWYELLPELASGIRVSPVPGRPRWPQWHLPRTATEADRALSACPALDPGPVSGVSSQQSDSPAAAGSPSGTALPSHSSRGGGHEPGDPQGQRNSRVWLIRAANETSFETWSTALQAGGWESVWWPARQPAPPLARIAGLLWDAEQLDAPEWNQLEAFTRRARDVPCVVLAGFLRHEEHARLTSWGIRACLPKPLRLEHLLWELGRVHQ